MIRWVKASRNEDKTMPPLEFVDNYFIIQEGQTADEIGVAVACYKVHNCDPETIKRWQAYKAEIADLTKKVDKAWPASRPPSNWDITRLRDQEATRAAAEERDCPKCKACISEPCFNLITFKKDGIKVATKMPHAERIDYS